MSTAVAVVLLGGFSWLKPGTTYSRNREQSRGGQVPRFEAMLGGASCLNVQGGREEESLQDLRKPGRAARLGG